MWVFGYGSLMWDGWENALGCTRREDATLGGYRREFSKASVRNWGSPKNPGPTLGLVPCSDGECVGVAFEFPHTERDHVLRVLREREGSSLALEEKELRLSMGGVIIALVAIGDRSSKTFIGDWPLEERARLAKTAKGSSGACLDYVRKIRTKLAELGIRDESVELFGELVCPE